MSGVEKFPYLGPLTGDPLVDSYDSGALSGFARDVVLGLSPDAFEYGELFGHLADRFQSIRLSVFSTYDACWDNLKVSKSADRADLIVKHMGEVVIPKSKLAVVFVPGSKNQTLSRQTRNILYDYVVKSGKPFFVLREDPPGDNGRLDELKILNECLGIFPYSVRSKEEDLERLEISVVRQLVLK